MFKENRAERSRGRLAEEEKEKQEQVRKEEAEERTRRRCTLFHSVLRNARKRRDEEKTGANAPCESKKPRQLEDSENEGRSNCLWLVT